MWQFCVFLPSMEEEEEEEEEVVSMSTISF
jgi:hypothetical protein